jgi:hypothetical protein
MFHVPLLLEYKMKGKGKGKIIPVLNQAPYHEGIWENWYTILLGILGAPFFTFF